MHSLPAARLDVPAPPVPALPCVMDIEASGFGAGSFPIEIGLVQADGSAYCTLVRPDPAWTHWDGRAERLHGITRGLLERHGRSVAEVAAELDRRLDGQRVYSDNWAHDYAWLARLYDAAGHSPRFTLHHLNELMDEAAMSHFDEARDRVTRALHLRRHRASNDARILQQTWAMSMSWRA